MMNMRVEEDKDLEDLIEKKEIREYRKCERKALEDEDDFDEDDEEVDYICKKAKKKFRRLCEDEEENFNCQKEDEEEVYELGCAIDRNDIVEECCLDMEEPMEQEDLIRDYKTKDYNKAFENAKKDMGAEFEKPGKAVEYKETHYFIKEHNHLNIKNPLWLDFANHILSNKSFEDFLSKYILYNDISFNEYFLILSVIGLPIENKKHEYKRVNNSRLISINPGNNLILFTKELSESKLDINNKLLISQNILDSQHDNSSVNQNNCTAGIEYAHQSIITNISNKKLIFQLFIQIPQGSICLKNTYYTNSIKIKLDPYETKNYKTYFYFPNVGKFPQYHPLACKNNNIISIGEGLLYNVQKEYIPSKKIEVVENNKYAKDMRIEGKLTNILSEEIDSKTKIDNILNYFSNDIFDDNDISNVLYLLKDKDFYTKFISILRNFAYYNEIVWKFAFYHKDEEGIKEYLSTNYRLIADLGYNFKSSLYSYSDIQDAKKYPHLDYSPLYNARKHPFGTRGKENEASIANKEFKETYQKFIIDLLPLESLSIKEKLQLTYYLILQDRMDEALSMLQKVKEEELEDNIDKNFIIQYDYINAYLDFCFGYPEFKIAKSLCNKYKDFPLSHWREKFEDVEDQILEYEKKEKVSSIQEENEAFDVKALTKELKEKEPKLSFNIENATGKITLIHSNISKIDIKLYFIDLETLFTREPRISELVNKDKSNVNNKMIENIGFVQANYCEIVNIPEEKNNKNDNITVYEIPEKYRNKNIFVEIKAESIKLFDICLSSNLIVTITESLGELKVIDNKLQSVIKAYVKVYVELNSEEVQFYKDGYTDLNGKFNYLELNTDQLKNSKKFYIFVSEEKQGSIIKECYPPKNIERNATEQDGQVDVLGTVQKYRQTQRNRWRALNK